MDVETKWIHKTECENGLALAVRGDMTCDGSDRGVRIAGDELHGCPWRNPVRSFRQALEGGGVGITEDVLVESIRNAEGEKWRSEHSLTRFADDRVARSGEQVDVHAIVPHVFHSGGEQFAVHGDAAVFLLSPAPHFARGEAVVWN